MLQGLNTEFGIEGQVRFEAGHGDLPKVVVHNELATAEVYLHGAHVTAFQPHGAEPMLWMSSEALFASDKPVRGGVPICWPWFSQHPTDSGLPQHGFARISQWTVIETQTLDDGTTQLKLSLKDDNATRAMWPHAFELTFVVTVGRQLTMELICKNTDDSPIEAGAALHTYFAVSQIEKVRVEGLAGRIFIDQLDNGQQKVQSGSISFREEVDRVYINTEDAVTIHDEGSRRAVQVTKTGSKSTVIWNPWAAKSARMTDFPDDGYKTMVCVETANAVDDVRTILPGEQHKLTQAIC